MARVMKIIAAATVAATVCFSLLYVYFGFGVFLSLAITFGTIGYHFCMRLLVGMLYRLIMNNRADYTRKWFQEKPWEKKLYRAIGVKRWKNKMPTYSPDTFDAGKHSLSEIAQSMCQSELVHETIVVCSFVPILFSIWFGEPLVFILTSVFGAAVDTMFVMMQRYNRPRIMRLLKRRSK